MTENFKILISYREQNGEITKEKAECNYLFDGENAIISYLEPRGENSVPTRVRILWSEDMLKVVRNGDMSAEFCFFKDNRNFEVKYKTAVGTLVFDTKTEFLDFKASENGCRAEIRYTISQNGDAPILREMIFEVK